MISKAIECLKNSLNEYLNLQFRKEMNLVTIQLPDEKPSNTKVSISFINIEKENLTGNVHVKKEGAEHRLYKSQFNINVYVLISVSSSSHNHLDAIKVLDELIFFFQQNNIIRDNNSYYIEIDNVSLNDLSNIWSVANGTNYPFFIAKIRNIIVSKEEYRVQDIITSIQV